MTHTTRLAFVGDIFLSGSYRDVPNAAQRQMFDGLAGALEPCSLVFGNFEGVVMSEEPSGLVPDKIRMSVAPAYLPALRAAGIEVLSLSNNHVFDYGPAAFEASRGALERAGFTVFGAGLSDDEALAPLSRLVDGLTVAFLGFTCASTNPAATGTGVLGVALRQRTDILERVAAAKRGCDVLVVSLHWGEEHVAWPSPDQLKFARALVDAGADIVAGHHAHVFQGVEPYRHGAIAYGLGGITIGALRQRVMWSGVVHDYHFEPQARHRRGAILSVDIRNKRVADVRVTPVTIGEDGRPRAHAGAGTPISWRLAPVVWRLPGYAAFFRAVLFMQFKLVPRLRWLFNGSAWRRLKRAWISMGQRENIK